VRLPDGQSVVKPKPERMPVPASVGQWATDPDVSSPFWAAALFEPISLTTSAPELYPATADRQRERSVAIETCGLASVTSWKLAFGGRRGEPPARAARSTTSYQDGNGVVLLPAERDVPRLRGAARSLEHDEAGK
jgi:hypothetical protein